VGTELNDTATDVTGGGTANPAGDGDYFAYFPGFNWKITDASDGVGYSSDSNTYYALIYNLPGLSGGGTAHNFEVVSYTKSGFGAGGKSLTVTRGVKAYDGSTLHSDGTTVTLNSGAMVVPCNSEGFPIQWALHMGAEALCYAKGSLDSEPIYEYDDYKNSKGVAHLNGVGIQGVRGMAARKDTNGRIPNFTLIEGVANIPGLDISPLSA
jgi:hypothetical protein